SALSMFTSSGVAWPFLARLRAALVDREPITHPSPRARTRPACTPRRALVRASTSRGRSRRGTHTSTPPPCRPRHPTPRPRRRGACRRGSRGWGGPSPLTPDPLPRGLLDVPGAHHVLLAQPPRSDDLVTLGGEDVLHLPHEPEQVVNRVGCPTVRR